MAGKYNDPTCEEIVKTIIEIISKNTPNEAVMSEVNLLSTIHNFQRHNNETPRNYVHRFNGAIADYVNQTTELKQFANIQFAILILRKAKLTSITINTVTFQLSTNAATNDRDEKASEVNLSQLEID